MNSKLSPLRLDVLKAIDAGESRPKGRMVTLSALWSRGLIADITVHEEARTADRTSPSGIRRKDVIIYGWRLTA